MPPTARERSSSRGPASRGPPSVTTSPVMGRARASRHPAHSTEAPPFPHRRRSLVMSGRRRLRLASRGAGGRRPRGLAGSPWAGGPGEEMCRTTATLADGRPAAMTPGPAGRVAPAVCRPPLAPRSREPLDARGSAIHIPGGATRTRPTATSTSGLPRGPDGADRSGRRRDRAWMLGGRRVPRPSWHGTSPGRAARGQAARLDAPQVPGM